MSIQTSPPSGLSSLVLPPFVTVFGPVAGSSSGEDVGDGVAECNVLWVLVVVWLGCFVWWTCSPHETSFCGGVGIAEAPSESVIATRVRKVVSFMMMFVMDNISLCFDSRIGWSTLVGFVIMIAFMILLSIPRTLVKWVLYLRLDLVEKHDNNTVFCHGL